MSTLPESGSAHNFEIYQNSERITVAVHAAHVLVGDSAVILPVFSRDMLIGLSSPLGRPALATHLSDKYSSLRKPIKISDVFDDLKTRFADTTLNGHLISLKPESGGRSTWYGLIDEISDEALLAFAEEGKRIVEDSNTRTGKNLDRRLSPFTALKESIEYPEISDELTDKPHMSRAFVTAGILTIGTVATVALIRRSKI